MKIKDLFEFEDELYIDRRIDRETELKPIFNTTHIEEENTVLILPKRIGSRSYTIPHLSKLPYAIIVGDDFDRSSYDIPTVIVRDPRRTAAFIFAKEYPIDYDKMKIIGVTGTNGKTTTAEILWKILRRSGYNVGFIGTGEIRINDEIISEKDYSMTTPDPDLLYITLSKMQSAGCEYAVMEVSSHSLALSKVAGIKFKRAIFTNLSEEHMDFHTDMEDYYKTKLSLFKKAEYGVFNLDDPYSHRAFLECGKRGFTVGVIDTSADANITDYKFRGFEGSSFFYKEENLIFGVTLHLSGAYNVYNTLLAIKCALSLGIRPCVAKKAISEISAIRGRMNIIKDEVTVIIDYAHTTAAMIEMLKFVKSTLSIGQSCTAVFGCGGERDKTKRALMGKAAEEFSDKVIITSDNNRGESFDSIAKMIESGMTENRHVIIESRDEAIRSAILTASHSDVVCVIGKGHERYIIDKEGKHNFDEECIVRSALNERRKLREN